MNHCKFCESNGILSLCGVCKSVYYCNVECQKANFPLHKIECKMIQKNQSRKIPENTKDIALNSIKEKDRQFKAINIETNVIIEKKELWDMIDEVIVKMIPICSRIGKNSNNNCFIFCCSLNCLNSHSCANEILFAIKLHGMMGNEIWDLFAYQYEALSRGTACQAGYGHKLIHCTDLIIKWSIKNQDKLNTLMEIAKLNRIDCPYFSLWNEFVIMWIDGDKNKQKKIIKWAIGQDCGPFATSVGLIHTSNLYEKWKTL